MYVTAVGLCPRLEVQGKEWMWRESKQGRGWCQSKYSRGMTAMSNLRLDNDEKKKKKVFCVHLLCQTAQSLWKHTPLSTHSVKEFSMQKSYSWTVWGDRRQLSFLFGVARPGSFTSEKNRSLLVSNPPQNFPPVDVLRECWRQMTEFAFSAQHCCPSAASP